VCVVVCPTGSARNADGICVEVNGGCPAGQESVGGVCVSICPTGFTRNAAGVCQENITVCGDGYTLNPVTGNCVPNNSIPDCGTGEKYNPATGQCEKIFVNTQEEYVTPTVYQPLPDNTGVYAAGEESLDTTFRESAPRTEVLDANGNLTNFDYTPAASLRSATGSGYNWTPPTVTSRPRSLMGADLLARYTGGRAAADLRQLTTGLGNGRTYSDYTGVLQNPGSYSGGLSKSQLYSRMRGLDYQRDAVAAADRQASGARGGISAYLAANPDIAASYEAQSGQLGGQSLEQFARNHYNTTGRAEMAAGTRGLFTLVESTGGGVTTSGTGADFSSGMGNIGGEGEGEDYSTSNWNQRYDMGKAGGVTRPFAHGGSVKKPQGFADGGSASADLKALDPSDSLFITTDPVVEDDSDNVQRDIPLMEWDGVERPTPMQTESQTLLENIVAGYPKAINSVGNYFVRPDEQGNPSLVSPSQVGSDVSSLGGAMYEGFKEDKGLFLAEMLSPTGEIISGADAAKFSVMANDARDAGDTTTADLYEQLTTLSAAGTVPLVGMGARVGGRLGKRAIVTAAEKSAKEFAEKSATQSARMLDEVDAVNAPRADLDFAATVVARMEEIATNPAVANDPVAMRFLQQIMDDPDAAIAQYAKIGETNGGKIINTDLVRELSPDYLADRTLAFNVHQPASALSELMFNRRVAETMGEEGTWIFTGGGPASGKTAGLSKEMERAADLVMDGTLAKFAKNDAKIEKALESGKDIQIVYIDRDPLKALPLALMRAMESGRPVPLVEFARMHQDARQSIVRLHEKYKDNPNVDIQIVDNQGNMGEQFESTIDKISEMDYDKTLTEGFRMLEEARLRPEKKGDVNGGISEAIYQGTKGSYDPPAAQSQTSRISQDGTQGNQGNRQGVSRQQTSVKEERAAALRLTDQQRADWREANKGDFRQEQTPELAQAAEKLGRGEISISDYSKEVARLRPIEPLTSVPRISTFKEIASALDKSKVNKGIIGLDKEIADGTPVGSRLDIPAYNSYDTWVVSVHAGTGVSGKSLGYGKVAVLDNVSFNSNPNAAYGVATGSKDKAPFARMNGEWRNVDPEVARKQAEEYLTNPDWVQVGMNPYRHSFFYDKATGQPLASADEVIQIGPLVLARNSKTRPLESPEHAIKNPKEGQPKYFKKGGSIERVYNDDRRYI
jgi:hypothetical protein